VATYGRHARALVRGWLLVGSVLLACLSPTLQADSSATVAGSNHSPILRIVRPRPPTVLAPGAQIRYEIEVSDSIDATSKLEVAANDVVLEVRFVDDLSRAERAATQGDSRDPPGLEAIKTSDCLNCHAFSSRLSGPSFREISKQYGRAPESTATLSRRVREGTSGQWGKSVMPAHPQLTEKQATSIVAWIVETGSDTTRNYYVGTEGSFRVDVPPQSLASPGGALVLTATYIDHGLTDVPERQLIGKSAAVDRVVLPFSIPPVAK
jgi:cytochrome c